MKTMNMENDLVLHLCRFLDYDEAAIRAALDGGADMPAVLGQLLYHRMGGVAYETLKACGLLPSLNREFRNVLSSMRRSYEIQTDSYCKALAGLGALFASAPFPYAFLKGAYLISLYPKGLRTSNDFDVLVNPRDVTKLENLLKSGGFVQGYRKGDEFREASREEIITSRMNRGETVPFVKRVDLPFMNYAEIDINFSLDFKATGGTPLVGSLLERAERGIPTPKGALYTLSKADFLIHLCAHLYKEASIYHWVQMGRDLSLYKFCDIYLYVRRFLNGSFAGELARTIRQYGMQKECYYALSGTRRLFSVQSEALDALLRQIQPRDSSYLRRIYDPAHRASYTYDMDYEDWLFQKDRLHHLQKEEERSA